ncbi:TPA: hypothetical protein DDZ01_04115 [Candidatus Uhrbacteria bacterium]|nr:MAG: hypothetical protein UT94_C0042G0005 [Candidatus Uhrbacteria bacterium GW2011_GWF2_40_263]HBK35148.1 hypothetical protein [Candidatus Uhrbacteria bacterium]HCB55451.1 hypothetical protein [Candidatus Uhrbacteria bacterium]
MQKRAAPLNDYFLLNMNFVIRFLILSDVVLYGSLGLLGPIFAIFIVNFIDGGNATVAGIAAAIYLVTKSIAQIPAATIIDKIRGEKDDFWIMFLGTLIGSTLPLCYLLVHTPFSLYIVQFILGLTIAFTFPSYMAIFTRHIDSHKEGTEWGVYFTLTDLCSAVAATIGGVLADTLGFSILIFVVVITGIFGSLLLLPLRTQMWKET